jgi:hypothetical protein
MSKSTLIKDIKKPTVQQVQPQQVQPHVMEQQDEDVTIQEVLSEIEREAHLPQPTQYTQPLLPQSMNSDMSSQLLQQQLLQQQMLQHQIQQQQMKNQDNEKYDTFFNNTVSKIKQIFTRDNNLLVLAIALYLTFTYVDVLKVLKIDNLNVFENYPVLINIVLSTIFGLTLVLIKPLM